MNVKLQIHENIIKKLNYFYKIHKIPNILFHGNSGVGKRTIVDNFINTIYNGNKEVIKNMTMYVNCAHGKGIKFIREDLKYFAKTHIYSNGGDLFKSIILLNADKLTIDAQSALRRCIELFSHNTRFFIIVEDKYKLLKPILSRFCEIYIPEPLVQGKYINLYKYNLEHVYKLNDIKKQRIDWLKKEMDSVTDTKKLEITKLTIKLYEKGYCGLDFIYLLENNLLKTVLTEEKKYELLFTFQKVRSEFRNEKLYMLFILNFLFLDLDTHLENISFI
jgi:DNA polymerase III delta prime subunit